MQALLTPFWLLAAAAAYSLSWLIPNHFPPWTSFHADALAGLVALALAVAIIWRSKEKLSFPPSALLGVLALLVIAVQYQLGLIEKLGVAWMNALYILGFFVAILIGNLWERSKALECADFVFAAALIGSLVSWTMQLQQWLDVYWLKGWILFSNGRYSANLAQPNQLASLMSVGVLACAWFYDRKKLSSFIAITFALILLFGLALANSRTSWINAVVIVAALFTYRKKIGVARLVWPALALCVVYLALTLFLPFIDQWLFGNYATLSLRSATDTSGRIAIWKMLAQGVALKPWLGYGWGQISYVQFMPELPIINLQTPINESHNIVLDLLICNGIPLGLFFIAAFYFLAFKTMRKINNGQQLIMALLVAVLLIHAMLEYPLEYAYFLIPFGLIMGALSASINNSPQPNLAVPKWAAWLLLVPLMITYGVTVSDYLKAEEKFYGLRFEYQRIATSISPNPPDVIALTQLRDSLILARVKPEVTHASENILWAESVIKSYPTTYTMYKLAGMYAFAQQEARAQFWMQAANRLSPTGQCQVFAGMWQEQMLPHAPKTLIPWVGCAETAQP